MLLGVPGLVGSALDPIVGAVADTRRRPALMVAGGLALAVAVVAVGLAPSFWLLLAALVLANPASGAFVGVAQATLMDLEPGARDRNMARWTLVGAAGYVAGPILIAGSQLAGGGWRAPLVGLGLAALVAATSARGLPSAAAGAAGVLRNLVDALRRLREREVVRWVVLLEATDLLGDVFHSFLALYFVDVAGRRPVVAALAVAVWTGASLVGDALLLALLRRFDARRYLRWSAAAALLAYPSFLLVPGLHPKIALLVTLGLLNSGWYALPKAGLYAALPGRSGAALALGGIGGLAGAAVPLALGSIAGAVGLAPTMWLLLLAPVALLAMTPRR